MSLYPVLVCFGFCIFGFLVGAWYGSNQGRSRERRKVIGLFLDAFNITRGGALEIVFQRFRGSISAPEMQEKLLKNAKVHRDRKHALRDIFKALHPETSTHALVFNNDEYPTPGDVSREVRDRILS